MLNVRLDGRRSPIRIICDSHLRIPTDCQICRTAKEYRTIVVYAEEAADKIKELHTLGVETLHCPDKKGTIDIRKLMQRLGNMGIDSILLEGGGTLNDSVLSAGVVQRVNVFIAPKIFGGAEAKSPVAGIGVALPNEAVEMKLRQITQVGEDLLLEYDVD
jgi:diaminohydroxyphosphoribosylaminopyrimidine deaminase/5-amino-6-(5-phosphoribosylamino)uracil reductase